MILVEYNGVAVGGTPYYSKAFDGDSIGVSDIPKSAAGKTVTFAGKFMEMKVLINISEAVEMMWKIGCKIQLFLTLEMSKYSRTLV